MVVQLISERSQAFQRRRFLARLELACRPNRFVEQFKKLVHLTVVESERLRLTVCFHDFSLSRVSVARGTAFHLAGNGQADPSWASLACAAAFKSSRSNPICENMAFVCGAVFPVLVRAWVLIFLHVR
jgi:hypothetical protein